MPNNFSTDLAHLQIQFISNDEKFLFNLPNEVVNVPITSEPEQLNLLINQIAESTNENWAPINFDFLIDSILLRTTLLEFTEIYKLSLENVLKIECIVQTPAPKSEHDLKDTEWVADIKILDQDCVFSVNYGGQFNIWGGSSKEFEKILAENLDDDPLKCLEIFWKNKELFALIGAQNQTIILAKLQWKEIDGQKKAFKFIPQSIFRGHQRSVECLSANKEGTCAISGSFDKCMKVWNIDEQSDPIDEEQHSEIAETKSKKMRIESKLPTKVPMVTLEAHREAVVDLCWDPLNTSRAISVSWDNQMLIWDLELAGPISKLTSNKAFTSLAVNKFNGIVLTGSTDSLIRMWDPKSKEGSMVKNTYFGHLGWLSDICWSPTDENLFVSASFDKTVKMWDIRSPKAALYDLMGHEDRVLCVEWSASGRIGSGSVDSTLKIFSCR